MPPKKMTTSNLKQLMAKLKQIQADFHDICLFAENIQESTSTTQIILRLENIDDLWERHGETLVEIESQDDFEEEDEEGASSLDKQRQEFSSRYYEVKSILTDQARERQEPVNLNQSTRGDPLTSSTLDHVRLPQIKLQTFNGEIDEWLSFRDLFTSLIHWKTDLPDVEKFHYLKGCLEGEPKNLVDSLQITAANYQVAWGMLTKRYNNSKQLKKRQIQSLLSLPILVKESASELHTLVEGFDKIVQTLDQIVQTADYKDLLLVNFLTSRLDPSTRRSWEEFSSTKEQDTLKELSEFLQRRVRVLESLPPKAAAPMKTSNHPQPPLKQKGAAVKTSFSTIQSSGGHCLACSGNHPLFQCSSFQRMSVSDRDSLIRSNSLCRNCFRTGHQAKECQCKYSCRNCKGRHHTLICFKPERNANSKTSSKVSNVSKDASESSSASNQSASTSNFQVANMAATDSLVAGTAHQCSSKVLLATAVVVVQDDNGNRIPARALLDSGSESNFATERLSQRLKVSRRRVDVSVLGIGQASTKVKQQITATIRSRVSDYSREMDFLVLPKVTVNLPTATINTSGWTLPEGVELADPSFCISSGVDLVLGIEAFFDFFDSGRKISLGERLPALYDSVFGWVVSGGYTEGKNSLQINCNVATTDSLEELLSRFWSMEELESSNNFSPEESRCEAIYSSTVQRGEDGRYTVSLPKDETVISQLGDSMEIAFRRFQSTERRLSKDAHLREQYVAFMEEYVELGHMRKVEGDDGTTKRCFLPHHPVVKEASTTTKVRVVYNASCKTSTGLSLNDALLVGPVIQRDLRSIILRCCTKQIMLVADVEKMFRQIFVISIDRPLQSILWRSSPSEEVGIYELNTVTYGTKPAPFLATRTLNQLAMDEGERYPQAVKAILEDTYMDDVITGCDTLEEAKVLQRQLDQMTTSGGFRLRKWASNCAEVLHGISEDNLAVRLSEGISLDPNSSVKTLGLTWLPGPDVFRFQFEVPPVESDECLTKRKVLSIIATLFDPLGFIGATTTAAKVFMQLLWTLEDENGKKLDWDHPLPSTVGESWRKLHIQLPFLNDIRIERFRILPNAVKVEIHCFSDASQKAYGACIYVRSQDQDGNVKVRLLSSKSRVAPLKTQSIPRLELCGALVAAQLCEKVREATSIQGHVTFWVDSTCALQWIKAPPSTWSVFVANRVAKIQAITEGCEWRHVAGTDNPADLISRGVGPKDIVNNEFWWHGPTWLKEERISWPNSDVVPEEGIEEERRRTAVVATASPTADFNEKLISTSNSYTVLVRRVAIWLRLIRSLQTPQDRPTGFLRAEELLQAEYTLIRKVQEEAFPEELRAVRKKEPVSRRSPLRWFHPYICEKGILRIGGRLGHSDEADDSKHPMILPGKHRLTKMLFEQYHLRLLHAGPQLLLGTVRQRYWPLGGRNTARLVVHRCVTCFKAKPKQIQQFMGELPTSRVTISRPFSKSGVDYFGPVYIRPAPRRAAVKAYVAIFVCMCTKAVHMELVSDLSTERFLQALRRFIARRGRCTDLYSDNGTNFVGARNQLEELFRLWQTADHRQEVARFCADEGIRWHFNPPGSPHFGGLWEAAVRSAKHHILRVIGSNPVSQEDMSTLLVQVEGCLNSRPLTPMSDDPDDLEPLTPAHFLVGSSLQFLPEPDLRSTPANRLRQYQQVQQQLQHFWDRWKREYLCQLQGRSKRWAPPVQFEVGRLVVIQDKNQPPTRWRMGRIMEVHPGSDGVVRVVTLKTSSGELKRALENLCLLPGPEVPTSENLAIHPYLVPSQSKRFIY